MCRSKFGGPQDSSSRVETLLLHSQEDLRAIQEITTQLQTLPMHLETLHATHIGRAMTAARKYLQSLKPKCSKDASVTEEVLSMVQSTLVDWRAIAETSSLRLKQRRLREAIADVANGAPLTPFERMSLVKEIKTTGRVEKKFGAGFDSSKYTEGYSTAVAAAEHTAAAGAPDSASHSAASSAASAAPTAASSQPKSTRQIPQQQGRLGSFFERTNRRGASLSAQRAKKRFEAHATAHKSEQKRQALLKQQDEHS